MSIQRPLGKVRLLSTMIHVVTNNEINLNIICISSLMGTKSINEKILCIS